MKIVNSIEGREVESVTWGTGEAAFTKSCGDGFTLHAINRHYGDHDNDWIVVMKDGEEVERHNVDCLSRIVWKPPAQPRSK